MSSTMSSPDYLLSFSIPSLGKSLSSSSMHVYSIIIIASGNHTFAAVQGSECYDLLKEELAVVIDKINAVVSRQHLVIKNKTIEATFFLRLQSYKVIDYLIHYWYVYGTEGSRKPTQIMPVFTVKFRKRKSSVNHLLAHIVHVGFIAKERSLATLKENFKRKECGVIHS